MVKYFIFSIMCALYFAELKAQITEAEIFFNSDPGIGKGISINLTEGDVVNELLESSTDMLKPGKNSVFIRVKESNIWSHYFQAGFVMLQEFSVENLNQSGYFFNMFPANPEDIGTISFSATQDLDVVHSVSIKDLLVDRNVLFYQVGNEKVKSHYIPMSFLVGQNIQDAGLKDVQYSVDPMVSFQEWAVKSFSIPQDMVDEDFEFSIEGLNSGPQQLLLRLVDENRIPSHYSFVVFDVCEVKIDPVIQVDGLELTCVSTATADSFQWLMNGDTILGATNQKYTVAETGDYAVIAYVGDCKELSSTINIDVPSGFLLDDNSFGLVDVFPNPASEMLYIKTGFKPEIVYLTDVSGRKMMLLDKPAEDLVIPVAQLKPGIYLLHIQYMQQQYIKAILIK